MFIRTEPRFHGDQVDCVTRLEFRKRVFPEGGVKQQRNLELSEMKFYQVELDSGQLKALQRLIKKRYEIGRQALDGASVQI